MFLHIYVSPLPMYISAQAPIMASLTEDQRATIQANRVAALLRKADKAKPKAVACSAEEGAALVGALLGESDPMDRTPSVAPEAPHPLLLLPADKRARTWKKGVLNSEQIEVQKGDEKVANRVEEVLPQRKRIAQLVDRYATMDQLDSYDGGQTWVRAGFGKGGGQACSQDKPSLGASITEEVPSSSRKRAAPDDELRRDLDDGSFTHNPNRKQKPLWHKEGPRNLDEVLRWAPRFIENMQDYAIQQGFGQDILGQLATAGIPLNCGVLSDQQSCVILSSPVLLVTECWAGMLSGVTATAEIFKASRDKEIDLKKCGGR